MAIKDELTPETMRKLYHMADAWKTTPEEALDNVINVLYSLMEMTGGLNDPSGPLDVEIEADDPEPEITWGPGGFIFEELDKPITAGNVLDLLALDLNDSKIIQATSKHNKKPELYGPGKGKGEELIIATVIEDNLDKRRGADIFWISEDTVNGKKGFWRKETMESMGPAVYAPPDILDLLTPTEDPDALDWREESRKYYSREKEEHKAEAPEPHF